MVYIIVAMQDLGYTDEDVRKTVEAGVEYLDGFNGTAIFPLVKDDG